MAGGCERSCALECLSALRNEPMRAAMFSIVKLNGSNANTSDERVIGDDLITAVTPPPPPKPKPAPTPEPKYESQPDPCWKREWIGNHCHINLDGTKGGGRNDLTGRGWGDFSGMSPGSWKINFPCGAMITGVAKCASNGGKWAQKGTPRGEGEYCWCKAETESTPYNFTPVWVFTRNFNDAQVYDCASHCADQCVNDIALRFEPRSALFGLKYEEYDD